MSAVSYDQDDGEWDAGADETLTDLLPKRRRIVTGTSAALVALLLAVIGFYAGIRVEKSRVSNTGTAVPSVTGSASRATTARSSTSSGAASNTASSTASSAGSRAPSFGTGTPPGAGSRAVAGGGASRGASSGTVASVDGDTIDVTESSGDTVAVKVLPTTAITKSVSVGDSSIRPGDTLVISGTQNKSGTVIATAVSDSGSSSSTTAGSSSAGG